MTNVFILQNGIVINFKIYTDAKKDYLSDDALADMKIG